MTENEKKALADLMWELSSPHSSEEIAEHLGCSRKHVWEVEKRALGKLKAMLIAEGKGDWATGLREPRGGEQGRIRTHIRDKNTR